MSNKSIHQFSFPNLQGKEISLEQYKGKVLLVVNTATECGFTGQLEGLQKLRDEFKDQGFEVLAFPSNQFQNQEPRDGEDISYYCQVNYGVDFPIFKKSDVKGENANEIFKFLSSKEKNGQLNSSPKWNFHKYVVDKKGEVRDFFYTTTKPQARRVKNKIKKLLTE